MRRSTIRFAFIFLCLSLLLCAAPGWPQIGNSGTIEGTVKDATGGVVVGATVEISNPVSGLKRSMVTDKDGTFRFNNVPFNPYHLVVTAGGFSSYTQDVDVRSLVTNSLQISLKLTTQTERVVVQANGGDLLENEPTAHTDVDRELFSKLPLESASSSVSSLVTLSTPGIAADSNGLFHGFGDHAENSFSLDGQQITDQQSKVFSNQIPVDSIQSLEVIAGAPPAEYGDKTSLVINVTTRSGQGVTTPHGAITGSYGSFGTGNLCFNLAYGTSKWGNFISANGLNTGRFLDPPEFTVFHAKGNEENIFDRVDYQFSNANSLHVNVGYSRSWFQNPNSFDQQFHFGVTNPVTGAPLGPTDQRSQINTYNIAPTWTSLISTNAVLTLGAFVRQDRYNYYPSADPFADFAPDLQSETFAQTRRLTNAGVRSNISYVRGIHNFKAGVTFEHTFLTEDDAIGIVDPTVVPTLGASFGCLDSSGHPTGPPCTQLAAADLTAGGKLFQFHGHTDVKEIALFAQDSITLGNWAFGVGLRTDFYRAISRGTQVEPRLGIAYNFKPSNTVLKISYARTLETPFNENLVIASVGCSNTFIGALVPPPGVACQAGPVTPGFRNEFHAGLQQAFGRYFVIDGEYLWKYTHNGYDFGVVGATPLAFPIEWHNSKIHGFTIRANVPNYHGFTAVVSMSNVAARFFLPQVAGIPIVPPATGVFRIDHDEVFNQTTHLQYQPWQRGPWIGFNWRYDSGLVAGATPCFNPATATCAGSSTTLGGQPAINMINTISGAPLTADQEFQAGFTCNGVSATPTVALPSVCLASQFGSSFIKVPAPGTENDDHNPQRIQPRSLFDLAAGDDNLFHGDRYKWSLRFTVINLTNKVALYNFLSTFSGTHYVTPRTYTAELGFHF